MAVGDPAGGESSGGRVNTGSMRAEWRPVGATASDSLLSVGAGNGLDSDRGAAGTGTTAAGDSIGAGGLMVTAGSGGAGGLMAAMSSGGAGETVDAGAVATSRRDRQPVRNRSAISRTPRAHPENPWVSDFDPAAGGAPG